MAARLVDRHVTVLCNRVLSAGILTLVGCSKHRVIIAVLLLFCVVAIVVSPYVDLPRTTLRARIAALVLHLAIIAVACRLFGYLGELQEDPTPNDLADFAHLSTLSMTCVWTC